MHNPAQQVATPLEIGDVLIRHPWAVHRGTPNNTAIPRAFATIRYVRRWYVDDSRDVNPIDGRTWRSLSPEQQCSMRFPLKSRDAGQLMKSDRCGPYPGLRPG